MNELLEKINKRHNEVDADLDKKLKLLDECLESGKECPCGKEECNIDIEELSELNDMYDRALEGILLKNTDNLKEDKLKKSLKNPF